MFVAGVQTGRGEFRLAAFGKLSMSGVTNALPPSSDKTGNVEIPRRSGRLTEISSRVVCFRDRSAIDPVGCAAPPPPPAAPPPRPHAVPESAAMSIIDLVKTVVGVAQKVRAAGFAHGIHVIRS